MHFLCILLHGIQFFGTYGIRLGRYHLPDKAEDNAQRAFELVGDILDKLRLHLYRIQSLLPFDMLDLELVPHPHEIYYPENNAGKDQGIQYKRQCGGIPFGSYPYIHGRPVRIRHSVRSQGTHLEPVRSRRYIDEYRLPVRNGLPAVIKSGEPVGISLFRSRIVERRELE